MPSELSESNINGYVSIYPIEYVTISFHLMNSIVMGQINLCGFQSHVAIDRYCIFLEIEINMKHAGKCIHPRHGTIDSKYKSQYSRVHIWWDMLYMVYVININTLY